MAKPSQQPVWATAGGAVVEPSGAKKIAGWTVSERPPARFFNWFMNLVYQWVAYFDTTIDTLLADTAFTDTANTFTDGPQTINNPDADAPLLRTTRTAIDGGTTWLEILEAPTDATDQTLQVGGAGGGVRMYSGSASATGVLALVVNARWHIGSSKWRQLDTAKPSMAILIKNNAFVCSNVAIGAADWSTWPVTNNAGSLTVSGGITAAGALAAGTGLSCVGAANLGGACNVTGGVTGASYDFTGIQAQTKVIPLADGVAGPSSGGLFAIFTEDTSGGVAYWVLNPGTYVTFTLRAPDGGTLGACKVILRSTSGTTYAVRARKTTSYDFAASPAGLPATSDVGSNATGTASAATTLTASIDYGGLGAGKTETYHVRVENTGGANQLLVYGVREGLGDPGPRNV